MDVRQLHYVVLLAKSLHFGRAAEAAFISQPAFSQQIARVEKELRVQLFDRSSNRVKLTDAGELFAERASELLKDFNAATQAAQEMGVGARGTLRLGIFADNAGEITPLIIGRYRRLFPQVSLAFVSLSMSTQLTALTNEQVDVAFLRLPAQAPGVDLDILFAEPRVAILPAEHRLATHDSLSVNDLLEEPFVTANDNAPHGWSEFWRCDSTRGEPVRVIAQMDSVSEGLAAVAYLGAVDTCPGATARQHPHPGVTYVPLRDGGYTHAALARRKHEVRPQVQAFITAALESSRRYIHHVPGAVLPEMAFSMGLFR